MRERTQTHRLVALEVISSLGPIPFYVLFCFILKDLFIYKLAFLRRGEAERTLPHTGPLMMATGLRLSKVEPRTGVHFI